MGTYRGPKRNIYLGPELDAAVEAYITERGITWQQFFREATAAAIGQPDLAHTVTMGRPKKTPELPPKKRSVKKH